MKQSYCHEHQIPLTSIHNTLSTYCVRTFGWIYSNPHVWTDEKEPGTVLGWFSYHSNCTPVLFLVLVFWFFPSVFFYIDFYFRDIPNKLHFRMRMTIEDEIQIFCPEFDLNSDPHTPTKRAEIPFCLCSFLFLFSCIAYVFDDIRCIWTVKRTMTKK